MISLLKKIKDYEKCGNGRDVRYSCIKTSTLSDRICNIYYTILYCIDQTFTNKQVTGIKITSSTSQISNTLLQEMTKKCLLILFWPQFHLIILFVLKIINTHLWSNRNKSITLLINPRPIKNILRWGIDATLHYLNQSVI